MQYRYKIVRTVGCLVTVGQRSEQWRLKSGALDSIPSNYQLFTFHSFITKLVFIEARYSYLSFVLTVMTTLVNR